MLKNLIPHSLFGRFLLIITAPTLIVQIVAIYVFYYTHVDQISKYMARSVLSEMLFIKNAIYLKENKKLVKEFSENIDISFYFEKGKNLTKKAKISKQNYHPNPIFKFFDPLPILDPLNRFKIELKNRGFTPFAIYKDHNNDNLLIIKVQLADGILNFKVPIKRITSSTKTIFILWMIATSLLTSLIAIIFLKNQIRSIKDLNIAADKFGRDLDAPNFKPSGAKEIRSVGISFIKMRERIVRQITQRTDMLSAVSHDLRTPLTRMKLQLEMIENPNGTAEAVNELKTDISDMEKMINEYLEFARGGGQEKNQNISIKNFLEEVVIYYQKMGKKLSAQLELEEKLNMIINPNNVKRALRNVLDNAFNYGNCAAIEARLSNNNLQIIIDDDGPGVAKNEMENIFKPFYRIDNSRNLDRTGTGLGLAIVRDIIGSHGGRVIAEQSNLGGLRITIYLPI